MNEETKRNLDLVPGNNAAYSNENPDALDSRYLHPEERELAEKLAEESGGQFTAEEMRDVLRHALPSDAKEYPQGLSDYVLDTAQATDETLQYMDGSEGRLVVTQDENGEARYVIQDIGSIPLNEDAKAYVQEQDLGYSFMEPTERTDDPSIPRDMLTGRPLDESGRYTVSYIVEGNVYSVPHYSCATADCLSQNLNVDWKSPEGQAYENALNAKMLDDASTGASVGLMFNPVGATATLLNGISITTGFGSAYLKGEIVNEVGEASMSDLFERGLKDALGKRTGVRVNTLLDLSDFHEMNTDFIPDDSTLRENLNNLVNKDDDEGE
ncbi:MULTISPECIES: hypothetical protein [Idiomarina]|jgi:hypothetical protein|uniref:hypothetical protein n=1 Tax=Idiomarina TaxID=135575 RepID=UPI000C10EE33|nr:hypothetical protein [Idiomarina sp.]PHR95157.1 MAG: hypothetical protein COA80_11230 [Leeuwenhoekiella sp.]